MTLTAKRTIPEGALENMPPPGKQEKALSAVREGATPLRDRTNEGSLELRLPKPDAPGKTEDSNGDEEVEGHETVELDSDGFVIWADTSSQEQAARPALEPSEEIRVLRAALTEALEENRRVWLMNVFFCSNLSHSFTPAYPRLNATRPRLLGFRMNWRLSMSCTQSPSRSWMSAAP